jgi:amidase/aspartyl-tRNA(Asn)/glutamyl-tRNA(Gln) amidotransferase subunit A
MDPEVARACAAAAERYAPPADRATSDDLRQSFSTALATYNTIVAAEAWEIHRPWADSHRLRYDPAVWQRLRRIDSITAAEIELARANAAKLRVAWTKFFLSYDFLVLPATPCPALTKAECNLENRTRLLELTTPASVGGLPVLTVPVALPSGLTTGLQIVVNQPRSPALATALAACLV